MESPNRVQILDEVVTISLRTNTFEKGMNPTVLPYPLTIFEWIVKQTDLGYVKKMSKF